MTSMRDPLYYGNWHRTKSLDVESGTDLCDFYVEIKYDGGLWAMGYCELPIRHIGEHVTTFRWRQRRKNEAL